MTPPAVTTASMQGVMRTISPAMHRDDAPCH